VIEKSNEQTSGEVNELAIDPLLKKCNDPANTTNCLALSNGNEEILRDYGIQANDIDFS
jgi:hypothetical protein